MDFLDPRLKRIRNARLIIGYILISLVIGLSTVILIFGAYGYGINTKTGQIIQNGLLFVVSQPSGAQVYLNSKNANAATTARLVLPSGPYSLTLKRDGYSEWRHNFTLDEHSISRFNYPLLFPVKPVVSSFKNYASMPGLITQSPDRRWLLVEDSQGAFDEYDTNDLSKAPVSEQIPSSLVSDGGSSITYHLVQWSNDNTHVLLRHDIASGSEFILFNRDKPGTSINLNQLFSFAPSDVFLRNQRVDQVYMYDSASGTVRMGDVGKGTLAAPMLTKVLAFKPYGANLASYVTDASAPVGHVEARIWNNGKTYDLYDFNPSSNYFVDAAQYSGHWYYLAGGDGDARIGVFKDPLDLLQASPPAKPQPLLALNLAGAQSVDFSPSGQFILGEKNNQFTGLDIFTLQGFSYSLPNQLASNLRWLDGAHLTGEADGQLIVTDYDGTNQHLVTAATTEMGGYLSRDLHHLISLNTSATGTVELINIDMRAGTDLPKQP